MPYALDFHPCQDVGGIELSPGPAATYAVVQGLTSNITDQQIISQDLSREAIHSDRPRSQQDLLISLKFLTLRNLKIP